ncbi:MAG TPA: hypothetical protein VH637_24280 [Streptosporangiaceae bacterium]|jgi:hypothetical protein
MTVRRTDRVISSFELHLKAQNKAVKTQRCYLDAARKLAAEQNVTDWFNVTKPDVEKHMISLLDRCEMDETGLLSRSLSFVSLDVLTCTFALVTPEISALAPGHGSRSSDGAVAGRRGSADQDPG